MQPSALRLGLTGGIGSGKTSFGEFLCRPGMGLVDSDQIARQLTGPEGEAIGPIAQAFGPEYVDSTGALDRQRMRQLAYADPQSRAALEAIIHPLVSLHSQKQAAAAQAAGARVIIFDVPLLVESGRWAPRLDAVIVVDCPEDLQIQRVMARSALDRKTVEAIMKAQCPRDVRRASADIVVHNGHRCTLAELRHIAEETAALFGL
jgi:dephospho-CoA kinase